MSDGQQAKKTAVPTREEVENLRQMWGHMAPPILAKFNLPWPFPSSTEIKIDPTIAVDDNVREAAWRTYQDAARRYADHLREREVEATHRLANTNTQLAGSQMWIALAVAAMTLGQLAITILNLLGGSR